MYKRIAILITLVLILAFGAWGISNAVSESRTLKTKTSGENVNDGMSDREFAQYMNDWQKEVRSLYSNTRGKKRASGLPDDTNKIIKTELISYDELFARNPNIEKSFTEEEKAFLKGKYELKIIFDNGRVSAAGPFKTMPKKVEIKTIRLLDKPKKVLIIED
ncbi:MAG: hypothetical protein AB1743_09515 [Actinomycetota bacterium]